MSLDNEHAQVDFPKLRRGGVDAAFFALYVPAGYDSEQAYAYANELLDGVHRAIARQNALAADGEAAGQPVALARTPSEALQNAAEGRFSVCLGLENASAIGTSLERLEEFHDKGVRYVTLCHSRDNAVCDSCAQGTTWHGLSPFGRELVAKMNELGMLVDVSHISDEAFFDVLECSTKPVIASHSCCRALARHKRNLSDGMIRALAAKGGVIQINFYPVFLDDDFGKVLADSEIEELADAVEEAFIADPADARKRAAWYAALDELAVLPRPSYTRIVDHIDYVVSLVGIDHVGIGSDFDGIAVTPEGLEDASCFPKIIAELRRRGYSEADIAKIAGGNFLRVWNLS